MCELVEQIQLENSLQTPNPFKQKAAAREGGCKVKGWSKPGIKRGQGGDPEEINKGECQCALPGSAIGMHTEDVLNSILTVASLTWTYPKVI